MEGPLELLDQAGDVVEVQTGTERTKIARADDERRPLACSGHGREPPPQSVIDDVTERAACLSRAQPQFRGDVLIERQGRAHIMMLFT